ncbi:MAG: hypothetical protein KJ900_05235 [Proteobacteria bacterium]|jgi:hypothetical protein|nr:hypothetical protein [Desulfocapsa sp.]MBU3944343.1 hypothetical protein [Pseudomonadota bacterium]MCG2745840.1 hypothetical protein [Desulfobacteraceae bacterium]MBU4029823.1 hypothetical protein [Pseudomonadota bacterium]MBU4042285.1 hypothetical protein [Pseudomonadota bacterium]
MMEETAINVSQLQGIVKERNEYKRLLDECLRAFNLFPRTRIQGNLDTYKLASRIEEVLRRFN